MAASASSSWPTARVAVGAYTRDGGDPTKARPTLEGLARSGEWMKPNVPNGGRVLKPAEVKGRTAKRQDGSKIQIGLEHQTKEWRTPQAGDAIRGPKSRRAASSKYKDPAGRHSLATESSHWSTPRASDGEKGGPNMSFGAGGVPLPTQAAHWPTPRVGGQGGLGNPARTAGSRIEDTVAAWPTPTTRIYKGGGNAVTRQDGKSRLDMLDWASEAWTCPLPHLGPPTPSGRGSLTPALSCYLRSRATTDSALRSEIRALALMGVRSRGKRLRVDGLRKPIVTGWTESRPERFVRPSFRRRLNPTFVEWLMRMPFGLSGFEREATELTRWLERMRGCLSALHSPSIGPPQGRLL